ncbi:unnamed protein product, partial [Ectocarpus sp. 6 AP-2014]
DAFYRTPETGLKIPEKPVTPTPAATPTATTTAVQPESTPASGAPVVIHG